MNDSISTYIDDEISKSNTLLQGQINDLLIKATTYTDEQIKLFGQALSKTFHETFKGGVNSLAMEIKKNQTENDDKFDELKREIDDSTTNLNEKQDILQNKVEKCIKLDDFENKMKESTVITEIINNTSTNLNEILESKAQITTNVGNIKHNQTAIKKLRPPNNNKPPKDQQNPITTSGILQSFSGRHLKRDRTSNSITINSNVSAKAKKTEEDKAYNIVKINNMNVDVPTGQLTFYVTWGGEDLKGNKFEDSWVLESNMLFENIPPVWLEEFTKKISYCNKCGKTFKCPPKTIAQTHNNTKDRACVDSEIEMLREEQMRKLKERYQNGVLAEITIKDDKDDDNNENKSVENAEKDIEEFTPTNNKDAITLTKEVRFKEDMSGVEKITSSITDLDKFSFLQGLDSTFSSFDTIMASITKDESKTSSEYQKSKKAQESEQTISLVVKPGLKGFKSGGSGSQNDC